MKRILQQNRKLAEELHMHVQETSVLQRDKKKLEEDNKVLTRELDIKNEAEQEYAKRGLKQAQELKDTSKKIQMLEKSLSQSVEEMKGEKDSAQEEGGEGAERVAGRARDVEEGSQAEDKGAEEHSKAGHGGADSAEQRGELFDLEPHHGEGPHQERAGALPFADAGAGPAHRRQDRHCGPELGGPGENSEASKFSKINSQTQQASFSRLPEHSFETSLPKLDSNEETSNFSSLYASQGELAPIT